MNSVNHHIQIQNNKITCGNEIAEWGNQNQNQSKIIIVQMNNLGKKRQERMLQFFQKGSISKNWPWKSISSKQNCP